MLTEPLVLLEGCVSGKNVKSFLIFPASAFLACLTDTDPEALRSGIEYYATVALMLMREYYSRWLTMEKVEVDGEREP